MGSVKPALTHCFPGISTPHHQHNHWDAVLLRAGRTAIRRLRCRALHAQGLRPRCNADGSLTRAESCVALGLGWMHLMVDADANHWDAVLLRAGRTAIRRLRCRALRAQGLRPRCNADGSLTRAESCVALGLGWMHLMVDRAYGGSPARRKVP
jgi:hypothetical protein